MKTMTAFFLSPDCGFVQTFSVRQSSLVLIPGPSIEASSLSPASVIPYCSTRLGG